MISVCCFQFRCLSIVTPRKLKESTLSVSFRNKLQSISEVWIKVQNFSFTENAVCTMVTILSRGIELTSVYYKNYAHGSRFLMFGCDAIPVDLTRLPTVVPVLHVLAKQPVNSEEHWSMYRMNAQRQILLPNKYHISLQWRHNGRDSVSNHQPHDYLLNRLFKAQFKENIKAPRHWPLWGEFTGDRWIPLTKGQ